MKFLTRERSKLGSAPGTIIQWALPVVDGDPDGSSNANDLPQDISNVMVQFTRQDYILS